MMGRWLAFTVSACSALLLAACMTPSPIPMGASTSRYGYISDGSRFGVATGMDRAQAGALIIAQGFALSGSTVCGPSMQMHIACRRGETFDIYYRRHSISWDWIYVQIADETVRAISWSFGEVSIDS